MIFAIPQSIQKLFLFIFDNQLFWYTKNEVPKREKAVDNVKGMIEVEVGYDSDLIMFHMLYDWRDDVRQWLRDNCQYRYVLGHFSYNGPSIYFESQEEAVEFKLTWVT